MREAVSRQIWLWCPPCADRSVHAGRLVTRVMFARAVPQISSCCITGEPDPPNKEGMQSCICNLRSTNRPTSIYRSRTRAPCVTPGTAISFPGGSSFTWSNSKTPRMLILLSHALIPKFGFGGRPPHGEAKCAVCFLVFDDPSIGPASLPPPPPHPHTHTSLSLFPPSLLLHPTLPSLPLLPPLLLPFFPASLPLLLLPHPSPSSCMLPKSKPSFGARLDV